LWLLLVFFFFFLLLQQLLFFAVASACARCLWALHVGAACRHCLWALQMGAQVGAAWWALHVGAACKRCVRTLQMGAQVGAACKRCKWALHVTLPVLLLPAYHSAFIHMYQYTYMYVNIYIYINNISFLLFAGGAAVITAAAYAFSFPSVRPNVGPVRSASCLWVAPVGAADSSKNAAHVLRPNPGPVTPVFCLIIYPEWTRLGSNDICYI
jgi:hypothetical protein